MTEETLDTSSQAKGRPTFLTVLCILTFIGSGLGLLGGLFGLLGASFFIALPGAAGGTTLVVIIGLLASILCLFGAIKMWGLAKQGFTLYLLGAILAIVASIISALTIGSAISDAVSGFGEFGTELEDELAQLGSSASTVVSGFASAAAWMAVVWSVIINGLFIGLYAANRKHLTK